MDRETNSRQRYAGKTVRRSSLRKDRLILTKTQSIYYSELDESNIDEISLNKSNSWKVLIDFLENNNVKKQKRCNVRSRKINYDIPATKKVVRLDENIYYYDRATNQTVLLGKYGPDIVPKGTIMLIANMKIKASQHYGYNISQWTPKWQEIYNPSFWKFKGKINYVEFDFLNKVSISHIGLRGLPYNDANFYGKSQENEKQFISKFEIKYYNRGWKSAGIYYGNSDRLNEKICNLDIPIKVRYVRFIPLTYEVSPSAIIRFFSDSTTPDSTTPNSTTPTITYTLHLPSNSKYMLDPSMPNLELRKGGAHKTGRSKERQHLSRIVKSKDY